MIVYTDSPKKVGEIYYGIIDYNRVYHNTPVLVLREASKEEYIERYKADNNGRLGGPLVNLEGWYFYEVSTD